MASNIPGRSQSIWKTEMPIPIGMGSGIVINFQPTGAGRRRSPGTSCSSHRRSTPVLKALRDGGIEVTALHSHMPYRATAAVLHAFLGER